MVQFGAPFEGQLIGDATRAPYSAEEWSEHWARMNGFAARANSGPIFGYDNGTNDGLEVTVTAPTSVNVEVKIGSALVQGTLYTNDATVTLAIGANASGNPRIDTVVARKDYVLQTIRVAVLQGTPAASPVPPTLTQSAGSTWEIPIADIAVANGFSTIESTDITPRHEWVNAAPNVYLDHVLNNSGGTLETGDVVIWDTSAQRAVTTTTTINHRHVAGVWVGRTANAARGRLLVRGIGWVKTQSATTPARTLMSTSGDAGRAANLTPAITRTTLYTLGKSIATSFGAGAPFRSLCEINVRPIYNYGAAQVEGGTTGFTSGAWRTRPLSSISEAQTGITLNANQLTIPTGQYVVFISAPAFNVDGHQAKLERISGSGDQTLFGSSEIAPTGVQTRSVITGRLSSLGAVYEIQHQCETTKTVNGMGRDVTFATTQRHLMCTIFRENDDSL